MTTSDISRDRHDTYERRGSFDRWWLVLLGALIVGALGLMREIDVSVFESLWAEDGSLFLPDAVRGVSIFEGYRGYFHLAPRVLAILASSLPLEAWPVAVSLLHLVVVAGLAAFVYLAAQDVVPSRPLRVVLAVWLLVNPVAGEVVANLTNLHWFLFISAFWAVFAPDRRGLNVAGSVIVGVAALSNPATALVGVVAVLRARQLHSRRLLILGAVAILLSGVHVLAGSIASEPALSSEVLGAIATLWTWSADAAVVGSKPTTSLMNHVPALAAALAAALVWWAVKSTDSPKRLFVVSALLLSVSMIALPAVLRGIVDPFGDLRLVVAPSGLVLAAVAVAASQRNWTVLLTSVVVSIAILFGFSLDTRSSAPPWPEAVDSARNECAHMDELVIDIPPPTWFIRLDCEALVD